MTGVTIAPASPPTPRLSVLPAPIDVAPGELTTPPSATVSVPTGLQPQLLAPIASELNAFKTEPAPVTITFELPSYASPMIVDVVELTTPPLAIVSAPGPTVTSPTKRPKGPPTFQVDPGPVTATVGVPRKGRKVAMSALPWLLSTPPLLMVRDAGAKLPMIVCPVTVTLEPATKLAPVSVRESALSSSIEPAPENVPENVVAPLPTMLSRVNESDGPMVTVPPPASDPISTKAPSPTLRAEPALTVKAGSSEGLLMMPPVIVKVAPF